MARKNKVTGIEMSGGTFANYSPGMMVIGSSRGRGDLVMLTEADLDALEGLLAQRKVILDAQPQPVAPKLKWTRHPSAAKAIRSETEHGVYYVEPFWSRRYNNKVESYRVSFVTGTDKIAQADAADGYVWQLDGVVAEDLGRKEFTLGWFKKEWTIYRGESAQDSGKWVCQDHAEKLAGTAHTAA
jgi:hypothetical protein